MQVTQGQPRTPYIPCTCRQPNGVVGDDASRACQTAQALQVHLLLIQLLQPMMPSQVCSTACSAPSLPGSIRLSDPRATRELSLSVGLHTTLQHCLCRLRMPVTLVHQRARKPWSRVLAKGANAMPMLQEAPQGPALPNTRMPHHKTRTITVQSHCLRPHYNTTLHPCLETHSEKNCATLSPLSSYPQVADSVGAWPLGRGRKHHSSPALPPNALPPPSSQTLPHPSHQMRRV